MQQLVASHYHEGGRLTEQFRGTLKEGVAWVNRHLVGAHRTWSPQTWEGEHKVYLFDIENRPIGCLYYHVEASTVKQPTVRT